MDLEYQISTKLLFSNHLNLVNSQAPIWEHYKHYPFYDWNNAVFQSFMLRILENLEERFFKANEIIYRELDESQEMYFVQSGRYSVGFEINKTIKYRLQFGSRTLIAAFDM